METKSQRIASFDCLRIVLSLFVILLHFNNSSGGGALNLTVNNQIGHEMLLLGEGAAICAVDSFMLLSGYFLQSRQKRQIVKPVLLMFTVMGYNSFFSLMNMLYTGTFSIETYIRSLIPINYFVWLYCVVYLLSPWFNVIFENVERKKLELLLVLMFLLFSVYPSIVDTYTGIRGTVINGISTVSSSDNGAGYTLVNFIFMYCLGAYLRKYGLRISRVKKMIRYVICVLCTYMLMHLTMSAINYDNVFVVLSAVFLVSLFEELPLKEHKAVTMLSGLTFQVFIIHCSMYGIWEHMDIETFLSGSVFRVIFITVAAIAVMYGCSTMVALCGKMLVSPFVSMMKKMITGSYCV